MVDHSIERDGFVRRPVGLMGLAGLIGLLLAGCGAPGGPSDAEIERVVRDGVAPELIYAMELDGYHRASGGMGAFGEDGFQDIYVSDKGDVRLTVERRNLTADDCPDLPVPAAEPPSRSAQCVQDGDGWRRTSGDRQEYAVTRGPHLVRVSGRADATTFDLLRRATESARPVAGKDLDRVRPSQTTQRGPDGGSGPGSGGGATPPERGDLPRNGDGAPDNNVGPGG